MSWSSKSHLTLLLLLNFLLNRQFSLCRFRIIYYTFQPVANPKEGCGILQQAVLILHQASAPVNLLPHESGMYGAHQVSFPGCFWWCGNLWFSPAWAFCLIRHCSSLWVFSDTPGALPVDFGVLSYIGNIVKGQVETSLKYSLQRIF